MEAASERYVTQLAERVRAEIGSGVLGVYLHGSAVLGGYDVVRSDLDVLTVVDQPLTDAEKSALSAALDEERLPCPARGLELSVVTSDAAAHPTARPPFQLHLSTAADDRKTVDGATTGGDPDLVLHFAVCRASGRAFGSGPPPEDVFSAVPQALVLAQLIDELRWALTHAADEYAVLNACRAWRFLYDGSLVSKLAGGEWALGHVQHPPYSVLVATALGRQRGLTTEELDRANLSTFVSGVAEELGRGAG